MAIINRLQNIPVDTPQDVLVLRMQETIAEIILELEQLKKKVV